MRINTATLAVGLEPGIGYTVDELANLFSVGKSQISKVLTACIHHGIVEAKQGDEPRYYLAGTAPKKIVRTETPEFLSRGTMTDYDARLRSHRELCMTARR